jgi:hypothetical protein
MRTAKSEMYALTEAGKNCSALKAFSLREMKKVMRHRRMLNRKTLGAKWQPIDSKPDIRVSFETNCKKIKYRALNIHKDKNTIIPNNQT